MVKIKTRVVIATHYGDCALYCFEGLKDSKEHLVIEFKNASHHDFPLVRLHSECITGDLLGSQMCDCGAQLNEAIQLLSGQGGLLIYLRQEGRGIGLYNKLEAYRVQKEMKLDTYEANRYLNLPDDSRDYSMAAQMLKSLGINKIKLLTNNPDKVNQLQAHGVLITERISTSSFVNKNNRNYLMAKLKKTGHLFDQPLDK